MTKWSCVAFVLGLAAVATGYASTGRSQAAGACDARAAQVAVSRFVAAFSSGNLAQLDRLVALSPTFERYAVNGGPGERVRTAARKRSTLIGYFAERHRHSERLLLTSFGFRRRLHDEARFQFEVVKSADDLAPAELYLGEGAIGCGRPHQLVAWAMGLTTEPNVPAPQSYAETCKLVASWCDGSPGGIPDALRRPLSFPSVSPGGKCPTTTEGQEVDNGHFGGFAVGEEPVQPIFWGPTREGTVVFRPADFGPYGRVRGWNVVKTLWFSRPEYQGPVLIRGRQLDGPHKIVFGEGPALVDPQLGPGTPLNGINGWREWPGGTSLRTPGCYASQIDGTDFSHVIVFEAVFRPGILK